MTAQLSSAAIAVGSVAMYQIAIKLVPEGLNPINALVTFYITALVCTLLSAKFIPVDAPSWQFSDIPWAAVIVGIAIVGIELGYLLMYRSGWELAKAPLIGMGGAAVLLVPISFLIFRETVSLRGLSGIVLCIYGLYLMAPKTE